MAKQTINIGASPNDGTGTPLRTAFDYTNQNFTEIYTALGGGVALPGATTQVIFNDGGTNLAGDAGLVYNKTTDALTIGGNVQAASATITGAATVGTTLGVTGVSTFAAGTAGLPALTTTGDTNTGIYFPAADTFAVTTGGAERYRVDAAGNCGIAVTPSAWTSSVRAIDITSGGLGVFSGGITHNAYFDNTDSRWEYKGTGAATFYNPQNGIHQWFVAASGTANNPITTFATPAMELNAAGNLAFANGKGIDFSATSGTGTSELLNDYEEGTWTGTLVGGTTSPTTPVTATGRYTKIGRQVSLQIEFADVNTTGASGAINVAGVPFTNCAIVTFGDVQSSLGATFTGTIGCYLTGSGVTLVASETISNSNRTDVNHNAGAGRYFWFNITYTVA